MLCFVVKSKTINRLPLVSTAIYHRPGLRCVYDDMWSDMLSQQLGIGFAIESSWIRLSV